MGTDPTRKAASIASVRVKPMKKKARFRVTPVIAAQKKVGRSTLLIFRFLKIRIPRIADAIPIRKKARENGGICSRVNFIMGAVPPQIRAAEAV